MAGFEEPDSGTIEVGDLRLADSERSLPPEERNVGVVFQDTALLPHLTLRQNIAFGLRRLPEPERGRRIDEVVELVRVGDAQDRFPHQVSGGQAQRAAIARALAPPAPGAACWTNRSTAWTDRFGPGSSRSCARFSP